MYLSTPVLGVASTPALNLSDYFRDALAPPGYVVTLGDSQLQRWSSLIGIITAIIGNILISFALNIQRYAHIRLHEERSQRKEKSRSVSKGSQGGYGTTETNGHHIADVDGTNGAHEESPLRQSFTSANSQSTGCQDDDHKEDSTYLRSPYWWGGIILMTVGEAGNFLAYGFAPASIVSPLGVVALISNCVIAPFMLKEQFRLRDFWGVVVAVGGAVTVVLSAKQQEKKLGPHEIWGAITTTEFEIYMGVTAILIAILAWASPRYGNKTILIDLGLVGLFGGYTALATKGVASMLSYTLWRALTTPVTYALLAVLVGTAILQVKYVNKALQRFDSTQVIPVQFVMFTLSVIIGSAILYRDFEKVQAENVSKFIGGCLLTFFGVFLITSGRPRRDEEEDEEESDEEGEERIGLRDQDGVGEEPLPENPRRFDSVRRRSAMAQNGGDAADDEAFEARRNSRVSFAEPSSRPRTPRMYSSSSILPPRFPQEIVVGDEDAPLLSNPWRSSSDDLLQAVKHPGMQTTISSPVLPTEAQMSSTDSLKPPAPPNLRTHSQGNPHTHPNQQQSPAPPQPDRPMTPARHSISRMMPGPLLSPLSGGLSVVVADSLRRGVDPAVRSRSFRKLRRSKSGSQRFSQGQEGEDEFGTSPSKVVTITDDGISKSLGTESTGEWSKLTRARSLSNTLGELIRGKRQKTDNGDSRDEEAGGPSGT